MQDELVYKNRCYACVDLKLILGMRYHNNEAILNKLNELGGYEVYPEEYYSEYRIPVQSIANLEVK